MGFAFIGFLLAAIMLIPNVLYFFVLPPRNVPKRIKYNNVIFTILERIGQIGCIAALILSKDAFDGVGPDFWFFLLMADIFFYYFLWLKFFTGGREYKKLFKSFGVIPIPLALSGVLAYLLASVWVGSVWLEIAAAVFAIGHIASSVESLKKVR